MLAAASLPATAAFVDTFPAEQLFYRGLWFKERGEIGEALKAFNQAVSNEPRSRFATRSLREVGEIRLAGGRYHDTAKGVAALETAALGGDRSSASRLVRLQLDSNVRPPQLDALLPIYAEMARESSNTAALLLARLTEQGRMGRRPATSSLQWYQLAAERGSGQAIRRLVFVNLERGREREAQRWLARMGGVDIGTFSLNVAKDYLQPGGELSVDLAAAVKWYERGLKAAPDEAIRSAARFLDLIQSDEDRATILAAVRKSADDGDPDAALLAARLIAGADPNAATEELVGYYATAAKGGKPEAVAALARLAGFLPADDPRLAAALAGITAAAEAGNADAMLTLANAHANGAIVGRDLAAALGWYEKAAEAGNAEAQFRAGVAFAEGLGALADADKAKRWLTAAAAQGYALAAPALAQLAAAE